MADPDVGRTIAGWYQNATSKLLVLSTQLEDEVVDVAPIAGFGELDDLPVGQKAAALHDQQRSARLDLQQLGIERGGGPGAHALYGALRQGAERIEGGVEGIADQVGRRQEAGRHR